MQQHGKTPLTDDEIDQVFNAVDMDGDKTTLTKDGTQFRLLLLFLLAKFNQSHVNSSNPSWYFIY